MLNIAYENNGSEPPHWVKYLTNLKFKSSIFSSKMAETVWNFDRICTPSILLMCNISINFLKKLIKRKGRKLRNNNYVEILYSKICCKACALKGLCEKIM